MEITFSKAGAKQSRSVSNLSPQCPRHPQAHFPETLDSRPNWSVVSRCPTHTVAKLGRRTGLNLTCNFSGVLFQFGRNSVLVETTLSGKKTVTHSGRAALMPGVTKPRSRGKTAPKAEKRGGYAPHEKEGEKKTIRKEKLFLR